MNRNDVGQPDIDFSNTEETADTSDEFPFFDFSFTSQNEKISKADDILAELENFKISDFANLQKNDDEDEIHEEEQAAESDTDDADESDESAEKASDVNDNSEPEIIIAEEINDEDMSSLSEDSDDEETEETYDADDAANNTAADIFDAESTENAEDLSIDIPDITEEVSASSEAEDDISISDDLKESAIEIDAAHEEAEHSVTEDTSSASEDASIIPEDTSIIPENTHSETEAILSAIENNDIPVHSVHDKTVIMDENESLTDIGDVEIRVVSWSKQVRKAPAVKINTGSKNGTYAKTRAESYSRERQNITEITEDTKETEDTEEADISQTVNTEPAPVQEQRKEQTDEVNDEDFEVKFCDFRNITPRKISGPHSPKNKPGIDEPVSKHGHTPTENRSIIPKKKLIKIIKETSITLGIFVLIFIVMVTFNIYVHRKNQVFGTSMEPTLHEGDTVYTTMLPYIFGEPEIGDIVIVDRDLDDSQGYFHMFSQVLKRNSITTFIVGEENITLDTCWIKRIVGLPGDVLEFSNGGFYRNSELIQEDYIKDPDVVTYPNGTTVVVPDGYVYVMGDNRNASKDSRDITVGPVPKHQIIGKMWKTG